MTKPMSEFTTDLQHSGMPAKDLDETIEFYTKKLGFELAGLFHNAKELGLNFKDTEIQHIDGFWEHGIRYFNVYGPNGETIEFCQIVK